MSSPYCSVQSAASTKQMGSSHSSAAEFLRDPPVLHSLQQQLLPAPQPLLSATLAPSLCTADAPPSPVSRPLPRSLCLERLSSLSFQLKNHLSNNFISQDCNFPSLCHISVFYVLHNELKLLFIRLLESFHSPPLQNKLMSVSFTFVFPVPKVETLALNRHPR